MTEIWIIGAKAFWCGCAALGFGVLFNAPRRSLLPIAIGGIIAGLVKFSLLHPALGAGVILGSFAAAAAIGFASIPMAHLSHVPPMIFAIPSVIPLVPGAFAYRTMLGLMRLTGDITADYPQILSQTVHNGTRTLFVIMALSLGVAIPMHVMRKESVKNIRLIKGKG
jgi:uncharacterized membrane protein YjjB (DUF3815 family)